MSNPWASATGKPQLSFAERLRRAAPSAGASAGASASASSSSAGQTEPPRSPLRTEHSARRSPSAAAASPSDEDFPAFGLSTSPSQARAMDRAASWAASVSYAQAHRLSGSAPAVSPPTPSSGGGKAFRTPITPRKDTSRYSPSTSLPPRSEPAAAASASVSASPSASVSASATAPTVNAPPALPAWRTNGTPATGQGNALAQQHPPSPPRSKPPTVNVWAVRKQQAEERRIAQVKEQERKDAEQKEKDKAHSRTHSRSSTHASDDFANGSPRPRRKEKEERRAQSHGRGGKAVPPSPTSPQQSLSQREKRHPQPQGDGEEYAWLRNIRLLNGGVNMPSLGDLEPEFFPPSPTSSLHPSEGKSEDNVRAAPEDSPENEGSPATPTQPPATVKEDHPRAPEPGPADLTKAKAKPVSISAPDQADSPPHLPPPRRGRGRGTYRGARGRGLGHNPPRSNRKSFYPYSTLSLALPYYYPTPYYDEYTYHYGEEDPSAEDTSTETTDEARSAGTTPSLPHAPAQQAAQAYLPYMLLPNTPFASLGYGETPMLYLPTMTETGETALVPISLQQAAQAGLLQFPPAQTTSPGPNNGDAESTLHQLVAQIEFYFSSNNLEGDTYLRSCMDAQGWVPLATVASFNRCKALRASWTQYSGLPDQHLWPRVAVLLQASKGVEIHPAGTLVRKKGDWAAWLLPLSWSAPSPPAGNAPAAPLNGMGMQVQAAKLLASQTGVPLPTLPLQWYPQGGTGLPPDPLEAT